MRSVMPPVPAQREGRLRDDVGTRHPGPRAPLRGAHSRRARAVAPAPTELAERSGDERQWGSGPVMRVLLVSPYSLSVFGGVQGQVLGLARSLRELGRRRTRRGAVRRASAGTGHRHRRPVDELLVQRVDRSDRERQARRPAHARGPPCHRARCHPPPRAIGAGPDPDAAPRRRRALGRDLPRVVLRPVQPVVPDVPAAAEAVGRSVGDPHGGLGGGRRARAALVRGRLRHRPQRGRRPPVRQGHAVAHRPAHDPLRRPPRAPQGARRAPRSVRGPGTRRGSCG